MISQLLNVNEAEADIRLVNDMLTKSQSLLDGLEKLSTLTLNDQPSPGTEALFSEALSGTERVLMVGLESLQPGNEGLLSAAKKAWSAVVTFLKNLVHKILVWLGVREEVISERYVTSFEKALDRVNGNTEATRKEIREYYEKLPPNVQSDSSVTEAYSDASVALNAIDIWVAKYRDKAHSKTTTKEYVNLSKNANHDINVVSIKATAAVDTFSENAQAAWLREKTGNPDLSSFTSKAFVPDFTASAPSDDKGLGSICEPKDYVNAYTAVEKFIKAVEAMNDDKREFLKSITDLSNTLDFEDTAKLESDLSHFIDSLGRVDTSRYIGTKLVLGKNVWEIKAETILNSVGKETGTMVNIIHSLDNTVKDDTKAILTYSDKLSLADKGRKTTESVGAVVSSYQAIENEIASKRMEKVMVDFKDSIQTAIRKNTSNRELHSNLITLGKIIGQAAVVGAVQKGIANVAKLNSIIFELEYRISTHPTIE